MDQAAAGNTTSNTNTNLRRHLPYLRVWRTSEAVARRIQRVATVQRGRLRTAARLLERGEVDVARWALERAESRDEELGALICALPLTPGGEARQVG